jgi:ubiquinone/menaquinone biosynthesis C-methylase UbiE
MAIHDVQNRIKQYFPEWHTQSEQYKDTVRKHVTPDSVILDIGCGRTDYMVDVYQQAAKVIGQDPDEKAILEHPYLHQRIIGDFDALTSLPDESVDIILSAWTLEHLSNPDKLFTQVNRLLKKGGVFISLTPNKFGLPSLISMLIPNRYHPAIVKKMWGRSEENTYPTFYKLNSTSQIKKFCDKYNLVLDDIDLLKDASYYVRNIDHVKGIYRIHQQLLPSRLSEGMLVIIKKP